MEEVVAASNDLAIRGGKTNDTLVIIGLLGGGGRVPVLGRGAPCLDNRPEGRVMGAIEGICIHCRNNVGMG